MTAEAGEHQEKEKEKSGGHLDNRETRVKDNTATLRLSERRSLGQFGDCIVLKSHLERISGLWIGNM